MKNAKGKSKKPNDLRSRAEAALVITSRDIMNMTAEDAQELLHELQVHQIELEMQNEELRRTQLELELPRDDYFDLYEFAPVGYLILNPSGVILKANLTAATMLGVERAKLICKKLSHFVAAPDHNTFDRHRDQVFSAGVKQTCELKITTSEGKPLYIRLEMITTEAPDGSRSQCRTAMIDITERKRAEEALRRSERELRIRNEIANIFLTVPDDDMYEQVLEIILTATGSKCGGFGYINEHGAVVLPSMTRQVRDKCQVPDKQIIFPPKSWADSSWIRAIREKRTIYSNIPSVNGLEGHITLSRHVSLPVIFQDNCIGLIEVADKETDYDERDIELLETIGRAIAPVLNARLQRDRRNEQRQAAEESLAQKVEELARSNTKLEQFVYMVSHDLKSPLVTIQGFADHMAQDAEQGRVDRLPGFARRITNAADFMRQLIDDLLNLSRIGRVASPPEQIAMTELIHDIARQHDSELSESRVALEVEDNMPTINADRVRILQVFDNLLTNALRHGSNTHGPRISIGARDEGNELRFFVRDNGPGIPADYHGKVFDLFTRLQTSSRGTGVGLAIVKQVVATFNGRVWIESELGQGATFWVALPKESIGIRDPVHS